MLVKNKSNNMESYKLNHKALTHLSTYFPFHYIFHYTYLYVLSMSQVI